MTEELVEKHPKTIGEDGYVIYPTIENCRYCQHFGLIEGANVCVQDSSLHLLFKGVPTVSPQGHCNNFALDKRYGGENPKYSLFKEFFLLCCVFDKVR